MTNTQRPYMVRLLPERVTTMLGVEVVVYVRAALCFFCGEEFGDCRVRQLLVWCVNCTECRNPVSDVSHQNVFFIDVTLVNTCSIV